MLQTKTCCNWKTNSLQNFNLSILRFSNDYGMEKTQKQICKEQMIVTKYFWNVSPNN